jgi:hypothetical protein
MEVIHPRCCALDVHECTVVACLTTPGEDGVRNQGDPHRRDNDRGAARAWRSICGAGAHSGSHLPPARMVSLGVPGGCGWCGSARQPAAVGPPCTTGQLNGYKRSITSASIFPLTAPARAMRPRRPARLNNTYYANLTEVVLTGRDMKALFGHAGYQKTPGQNRPL